MAARGARRHRHRRETEALARSIPDTGGVYFVPALVGPGAPNWEPGARGTIVGITGSTGRPQLARAALDAMAYGTHDVLEVMHDQCGRPPQGAATPLRVDGGATAKDWLMQFQADVLGVPVERPAMVETTALGAAGLAGLAAGVWGSAEEFVAARELTSFVPGPGAAEARRGLAGWHRAVRATLAWARDGGGA